MRTERLRLEPWTAAHTPAFARLAARPEFVRYIRDGAAGLAADELEFGWWLDPALWGRGLAREGAAAVRDEAFDRLGAPSVLARIKPENAASIAVATSLGLTPDGETTGRLGEPVLIYRRMAARTIA